MENQTLKTDSQKKDVFVIMRYNDQNLQLFDELVRFEDIKYINFTKADTRKGTSNIIGNIIEGLFYADFVLALLFEYRHNVMYELGIAHAINKPTLLVTDDFSDFPFDLNIYHAIEIKNPHNNIINTVKILSLNISESLSNLSNQRNPVKEHSPLYTGYQYAINYMSGCIDYYKSVMKKPRVMTLTELAEAEIHLMNEFDDLIIRTINAYPSKELAIIQSELASIGKIQNNDLSMAKISEQVTNYRIALEKSYSVFVDIASALRVNVEKIHDVLEAVANHLRLNQLILQEPVIKRYQIKADGLDGMIKSFRAHAESSFEFGKFDHKMNEIAVPYSLVLLELASVLEFAKTTFYIPIKTQQSMLAK